jgi:hypothetical protein
MTPRGPARADGTLKIRADGVSVSASTGSERQAEVDQAIAIGKARLFVGQMGRVVDTAPGPVPSVPIGQDVVAPSRSAIAVAHVRPTGGSRPRRADPTAVPTSALTWAGHSVETMGFEPTTPCLQSTPGYPWWYVGDSQSPSHKGSLSLRGTHRFVPGRDRLAPLLAPRVSVDHAQAQRS